MASYKAIKIGNQKDEIANETIEQQIESQTIRVNCHKNAWLWLWQIYDVENGGVQLRIPSNWK